MTSRSVSPASASWICAGSRPASEELSELGPGIIRSQLGRTSVARGGRFFLLAVLLRRYGLRITAFLETRLNWIALGVTALAVLAFIAFEVLR